MMTDASDPVLASDLLEKAEHVYCICHRNPDGDAIGSLLGIGQLIELRYPEKIVTMHCIDPIPETFHFLPGAFRVKRAPELPIADANPLFVFVDCAEPKMTEMHKTHAELFEGIHPSINIDHHHLNPHYGTANFVFPDAASACEIVLWLAQKLQWKMTADIATCLLTGVYTDTGGLLHSNTTSAVYRTVADLLRAGARRQEVVTAVFRTAKISTLRLWGRALEKISLSEEGGAVSAVTEGDFRATGADYSELTGAIDYVNAVPGMRFSLILSEKDGKVKGSLRTLRDDVDVSEMAGRLSGGGHRKAAGFAVAGKLQPEVRWKVVEPESERLAGSESG